MIKDKAEPFTEDGEVYDGRSVVVYSCKGGVGKSTIAANLA